MHTEGLEHRRRNSRVEKLSAARPAGWCVNGRQQDRGLFRTRGAAGWLAGVLHSQLQRLRSLREGQALRPRKHRPPSHPSSASQSERKSILRTREGCSEGRGVKRCGGGCPDSVQMNRLRAPIARLSELPGRRFRMVGIFKGLPPAAGKPLMRWQAEARGAEERRPGPGHSAPTC